MHHSSSGCPLQYTSAQAKLHCVPALLPGPTKPSQALEECRRSPVRPPLAPMQQHASPPDQRWDPYTCSAGQGSAPHPPYRHMVSRCGQTRPHVALPAISDQLRSHPPLSLTVASSLHGTAMAVRAHGPFKIGLHALHAQAQCNPTALPTERRRYAEASWHTRGLHLAAEPTPALTRLVAYAGPAPGS